MTLASHHAPALIAQPRNDVAGDRAALMAAIRKPRRFAYALVAVFFVGFGAWGALAPLAGGAVAPGIVSPDGSRRTVQHLEGGIVGALLVREGDMVTAGEPLLNLESVISRATYDSLASQYWNLLAAEARLIAEQAGANTIAFPPELESRRGQSSVRTLMDGQKDLFHTRKEALESRERILFQKIEQHNEQIRALQAQVDSAKRQAELIADELAGKQTLFSKGLIPKPEVRRLERAEAEILGRQGEYTAMISRVGEQIGEAHMQAVALRAERSDEISTRLQETRSELASLRERLLASEDVLKRTQLLAPVNGRVVNLRIKTVGGVVRPGEAILDIVPSDETLLIDSRVSPIDIDVVRAGLEAQVRFNAFSARNLPRVIGVVRTVSADRMVEERTGQPYYLARVEVSRKALAELGPDIDLVAGMPAEVLIVTGARTMWRYLFQPFLDAVERSFREV